MWLGEGGQTEHQAASALGGTASSSPYHSRGMRSWNKTVRQSLPSMTSEEGGVGDSQLIRSLQLPQSGAEERGQHVCVSQIRIAL